MHIAVGSGAVLGAHELSGEYAAKAAILGRFSPGVRDCMLSDQPPYAPRRALQHSSETTRDAG